MVFCNTGLEHKSIVDFVKTFPNVTIIRPKIVFDKVIKEYGYPIISKEVSEAVYNARKCVESNFTKYIAHYNKLFGLKTNNITGEKEFCCDNYKMLFDAPFKISHKCCEITKHKPFFDYEKQTGRFAITGERADECQQRKSAWLKNGCNIMSGDRPKSKPISIWLKQDELQYIKNNQNKLLDIRRQYLDSINEFNKKNEINSPIASIYGDIIECDLCGTLTTSGIERSGCTYCLYGAHKDLQGKERLLLLKQTDRKRYDYILGGGEFSENGMWQPNKSGLGYKFVIDWCNENIPNFKIKY